MTYLTKPVKYSASSSFGLSLVTLALALTTACGEDSSSSNDTTAGESDAGETATQSPADAGATQAEQTGSSGIQCAATFNTGYQSVQVEQDGGSTYVDLPPIEGMCQQTTLLHPIDGSSLDSSCDWLTGLSSMGVFKGNGFEGIDVRARECEPEGCIKKCLKLVRPTEQGSITILDQQSFDVTATLYDESALATFELWCENLNPAGQLLDCE